MSRESGFSLVEMMVVMGIVAIMATVAIPAYINYINRMNQGDAVTVLMNAKMDMESFYEGTFPHRYANTIGCLPSCNRNVACLSDCANCGSSTYLTGKGYTITVVAGPANTQNFQLTAEKKIYSYRATDQLRISATVNQPVVLNTSAIGFSLFRTLFQ
jgi:prepilin-type N-terminal cleavage/methylation domain-containing protein